MIQPYDPTLEQQMKFVYDRLSEKDRRLYAAVEVRKLPRGGQSDLTQVLGCARQTVQRGLGELLHPERLPEAGRIRHPGGGRKRLLETRCRPTSSGRI